jgi:hypothetical protein
MAVLSRHTVPTSHYLRHPISLHFKFSTIHNTNMEAMQLSWRMKFNTGSEVSCSVKPLQNKQLLFVECEITWQQRKTRIPPSVWCPVVMNSRSNASGIWHGDRRALKGGGAAAWGPNGNHNQEMPLYIKIYHWLLSRWNRPRTSNTKIDRTTTVVWLEIHKKKTTHF